MVSTRKIRNMITNNKKDKLTYDKESGVYTFKTYSCNSAGWIVGLLRFILREYEPEFLEYYKSTKTWKERLVTIKFYLRGIQ